MSSLNYMDLCRLCLVKEQVSVPIFDGEGDVRQIFIKITTCLPVKVSKEDSLPKKICSNCVYRVENSFEFWNTTVSAEKQLLQWLGDSSNERKLSPSTVSSNADQETVMETEQLVLKEERLEHDQSESLKSTGRAAAGGATPALIEQVAGAGTGAVSEEEDEDESEDGEEAAGNDSEESAEEDVEEPANKEEVESEEEEEDEPYEELEPTTFVNVSLACDEAGPSGMQQQSEGSDPKQTQSRMKAELAVAATAATSSEEPSTSASAPSTSGFANEILLYCLGRSANWLSACRGRGAFNPGCPNPYGFTSVNHINKSSNVPTLVFMKQFSNEGDTTHICDVCSKNYSSVEALRRHKKRHSEDRPHACDSCSKRFKCKGELKAHQSVHNGNFTFSCEFCKYITNRKTNLMLHRKRHLKQFSVNCNICGKGFYTKQDLREHDSVHTGLKPYLCDICGWRFTNVYSMSQHKLKHDPNYKPNYRYSCNMCGKAFVSRKNLSNHLKNHIGVRPEHVCDFCGKLLSSRDSLKTHRRTHTGEKPFVCSACGKAFSDKKYLSVHQRTHTGERPYCCNICGKCYTQRSTLQTHKKSFHKMTFR